MIDEKGRLFGKINVIDLLVILLIVLAVIVVAIKAVNGGLEQESVHGADVVYTVKVSDVDPAVYASIQKAMQLYPEDPLMSNGEIVAGSKVTKVTSQPHKINNTLTVNDSAVVLPLEKDTLDLTFTIQATVKDSVSTEVGSQEVRIGKSHIVKTQHFELTYGVITECTWTIHQ